MSERFGRWLLSVVMLVGAAAPAGAGQAMFTSDQSHVLVASDWGNHTNSPSLIEIDLVAATIKRRDLSAAGIPDEVIALSAFTTGTFVCATHKAVYVVDEEFRQARLIAVPPPPDADSVTAGQQQSEFGFIRDVVTGPGDGTVYFVTHEQQPDCPDLDYHALYITRPDDSGTSRVLRRRIPEFDGLCFEADGTAYFATRKGDLWSGRISQFEGDDYYHVDASRFAPLATHEGFYGTPDEIGVEEAAVAGPYIYCILRRMEGSGWGVVLRLPGSNESDLETSVETDPAPSPLSVWLNEWQGTGELLRQVEVIENTWAFDLAANRDGSKVIYYSHDHKAYKLIENHGTPRTLQLAE